MRKIGKAHNSWEFLRRKKTFLKFITTNARMKNSKGLMVNRRISTTMSFFEEKKHKKKSPLIMMPNSYVVIITDFISTMAYILSFFLVLYVISSNLKLHDDFRYYEIIIDIILFGDMILRFVTAYDNDLEKIIDHKTIAVRYISNLFVFDFLAIVPGLISLELFKHLYPLKLFRYIHIPKFFTQVDYSLTAVSKRIMIIDKHLIKLSMKIIKAILTLLLGFHVFS